MSFYEKHYEMCKKYIDACSNPDKYTREELFEITRQQRISEGEFMQIMDGRKILHILHFVCQRRKKKGEQKKPVFRRSQKTLVFITSTVIISISHKYFLTSISQVFLTSDHK